MQQYILYYMRKKEVNNNVIKSVKWGKKKNQIKKIKNNPNIKKDTNQEYQ